MFDSNLILLLQLQAARELHKLLYSAPRATMPDITRIVSRISNTFSLWHILLASALAVCPSICNSILRIGN